MAFCTQCTKEMGQTDVVCPHCGYDYATHESEMPESVGLAYSGLADLALIIGQVMTAISCIITLIYGVIFLLSFHFLLALGAVIGFFLSLANFVVFVRIRDMKDNRT